MSGIGMCGGFTIGHSSGTDCREWLLVDPKIDWPVQGWPNARWNVASADHMGIVRVRDDRADLVEPIELLP